LRVCLISTELFGRGSYGGFGRATRVIGRELVQRGHEVSVVVPVRRGMTPDSYELDGVQVHEFAPNAIARPQELFRAVDAEVYHSQDPSLGTWLAQRAMPHRAHVITFRDPMTWRDWAIEARHAETPLPVWWLWPFYVENPLVRRAVRQANRLFTAAEFMDSIIRAKFRRASSFLPTPVDVPDRVEKSAQPTVCFVARFDRRKQPERFFALARAFPDVRFVAVGATSDAERDARLRAAAGQIPNLELTGVIDQFTSDRLFELYSQSWVLVSSSLREGLPNTFLEAAAGRCAILSTVDPDGFASRFGHHAADGDLAAGLQRLLDGDRWRAAGERGHEYVSEVFAIKPSIERHLAAYEEVLGRR
jgi:glycosyltransferase involved in cell wall biosynthesis